MMEMVRRPLIRIDEEKCDGCGQCILSCAEGALQIIDGKARLISEELCDGLGACIQCPKGALRLEEREAMPFSEGLVQKNKALHAKKSQVQLSSMPIKATVPNWPIQLRLLNPSMSFLEGAHWLLVAHCAGFANPSLWQQLLAEKILIIACPKLEPKQELCARLTDLFAKTPPKDLLILRMRVPCCGGLVQLVEQAMALAHRVFPCRVQIVDG